MDGLDALGAVAKIPLVFRLIDQSKRHYRDIFRGTFNRIASNYLVPSDFPYNQLELASFLLDTFVVFPTCCFARVQFFYRL